MWNSGKPAFFERSGPGFFLAALFLLASLLWRFSDLPNQMDLRLYDESYYLCQGAFQPVSTWFADYSALYSLWYKWLHLVSGLGATELYYLNYGIWTLVLGLVVYHFSRLAGLAFPLALSWALLATAAQIGLPLWPKVGHFAMLGSALLLLFLLKWKQDKALRMWVLSGGLFLMAWARPEFFAGGLLALALGVFYLFSNRFQGRFWVFWPVALLFGLDILLFVRWGLPVGRSGRGMVAFGQHFVHNWRMMQGMDPAGLHSDWVNWRELCRQVLGTDESLLDACINQPFAILKHLFWNVGQLVWVPFQYFFETLFPQRFVPFSVPVGVAILFVGLDAFSGFKVLGERFSRGLRWLRFQGLDLLPLLLPPVLAGLLFQARPHYLLPLFPFFVLGVGKILAGFQVKQISTNLRTGLYWGASLFIFLLLPKTTAFFKAGKDPLPKDAGYEHFGVQYAGKFPHRTLVQSLQSLAISEGSRWFDASTGAAEFLGQRIQRFGKIGFELDYPEIQDVEKFIRKNDIQCILLHPTMDFDHILRRNPYLSQLRKDPGSLHWEKRKLTDAGDSLLVRLQK